MPARKPVLGAVLRVYGSSGDGADERIRKGVEASIELANFELDDRRAFKQVIILVPVDHDTCHTAERLRDELERRGRRDIVVLEEHGYHSGAALNGPYRVLRRYGVTHVLYISRKAVKEHLTASNLETALYGLRSGFKVVGIRFPEFGDETCNPINNTFAVWEINPLDAACGFDSLVGVEEVRPVIEILRLYGSGSVGYFESEGAGLDLRVATSAKERHDTVVNTKKPRQEQEAARAGESLDFITSQVPRFARPKRAA